MQASTRFTSRTIALTLTILVGAMTGSVAHAGAKCPDRFFKKVQIRGVGDTQANAQAAYDNDMAAGIPAAQPDSGKTENEENKTEARTSPPTKSKKASWTP